MPTYDYACKRCGHAFELFQGLSEPLRRKCPECGRLSLQRLFGTGAAVVFKGSGFYETDYKRAPRAGDPGQEGKGKGKTDGDAPASSPADGGTSASDATGADAAAAKPGAAKPGAAKPGASKPGASKPGAGRPNAGKPGPKAPGDASG